MGIGTQITMQVQIEPQKREVAFQRMLARDKVARVELEAFLEEAIKTFLRYREENTVTDINVTIK